MMYHHNPTCRKFKEIKRKRSALNSWRGRANLVFFAFFFAFAGDNFTHRCFRKRKGGPWPANLNQFDLQLTGEAAAARHAG